MTKYLTPLIVLLVIVYEQGIVLSFVGKINILLSLAYYAVDVPYFFLFSHKLFPFIIETRQHVIKKVIAIILAFSAFIFIQNLINLIIFGITNHHLAISGIILTVIKPFWRGVYLIMLAAAFYSYKYGINKAKTARDLEVKHLELKTAFLRSQLKPHFINNTLQSIYLQAIKSSPAIAEKIAIFIEVLHYARDNDESEGTIGGELEQVENVISLNKSRLGEQLNLHVALSSDADTASISIPPLFLINIVENMFTHGYMLDHRNPGILQISGKNKRLELYARNQKAQKVQFDTTGLGLSYVTHQLERLFAGRYTYRVNEDENYYELNLAIEL